MGKEKISYQQALEEIEGIVTEIESGNLDVDQLNKKVKRAILLMKECKKLLRSTENDLEETLKELDDV